MAFDGLINKSVVYELNTCLIGGKIDKIFCPSSNEILLGVYSNGVKYALNINISSNNYRINLTTNIKANPLTASNFCMVLRKHLLNTKIFRIYTIGIERVVVIEFEDLDTVDNLITKKMIIELMGKHCNVVLLDEDDIIINSLKQLSTTANSNRNILPKYKYVFPFSNKLDLLSINNFETFLNLFNANTESDITSYISSLFTGISKIFIEHCCNLLNISKEVNKNNLFSLYNYIHKIINDINSNNVVCVALDNDYSLEKGTKTNNFAINFFLDDFYTKKENTEFFSNFKNDMLRLLLNNIKKMQIKLQNVNEKLKACKEMDKYKLYGELITSNLYRIGNYNTNSVKLENYYDGNKIISIPLDNSISPSENAKKFFKKYSKMKSTFEIVNKQKEEIEKEILYIESIIYDINESKTINELNDIYQEIFEIFIKHSKTHSSSKKKSFEFLKYTIDGFTVFVGKNNLQNDYITNKLAVNNDYWFHVKDSHGSHVILKTENKVPSQEIINKCASIAAYYSKSKYSSNVPVDYTLIKNVKKIPKAKPGMVIYTNYKTVNVAPQK